MRITIVILVFLLILLTSPLKIKNAKLNVLKDIFSKNVVLIKTEKSNILKKHLNVPYEKALFLFSNGDVFTVTNYFKSRIFIPDVEGFFAKAGHSLDELLMVYHNHNKPYPPSTADIRFYYGLKSKGFNGVYGVYYPATKKVVMIKKEV